MFAAAMADHDIGAQAQPLRNCKQCVARHKGRFRAHVDSEEILFESFFGRCV